MKSSTFRNFSCCAIAVAAFGALAGCAIGAQEASGSNAEALSSKCAPSVPAALAVPEGNKVAFFFDATGVQIYACTKVGTNYSWVFQAPEATLLNPGGQVAGTHFVGPTWQANDGSKVVGVKLAGVGVDKTAIPWLLLKALSNEGDGRMAKITYIQRLDTAGGIAPAAEECSAASVGTIARVDYAATYFFYEASEGNSDGPSSCE
jgi:uncharacterized protein DUF3455